MFCSNCGTRFGESEMLCTVCGASRPAAEAGSGPAVPQGDGWGPVAETPPVNPCALHPRFEIGGTCPRCSRPVCVVCAPDGDRGKWKCSDCLPLTAAHLPAPSGSTCVRHPAVPATFVCARCGSFCCTPCASLDDDVPGRCNRCHTASPPLAGLGPRFLANLVDSLVVGAAPILVGLGIGMLGKAAEAAGFSREKLFPFASLGVVIGLIVQAFSQVSSGQSVGKRLFRIKVVRVDGSPVAFWRLVLLRNAPSFLCGRYLGCYSLFDALSIWSADRRCLHDRFADTKVIEAPRVGPRQV